MATKRICSIHGCGKPHRGRGLCNAHLLRLQRHGDPLAGGIPRGAAREFLEKTAATFKGEECLLWPFSKNRSGYGTINIEGTPRIASRVVCAIVHGAPPSSELEAAHKCGNPTCVNPQHIRWATSLENSADQLAHGTRPRGEKCHKSKLTEEQVLQIRSLKGRIAHSEIAKRFGVQATAVSLIMSRKNWGWLE